MNLLIFYNIVDYYTVCVLIGKSQKALSKPHDMLSLLDIDNYS